ncbi:hypothetical protein TNCV_2876421 [Trichonephila clavipes]|nr:hypothetical protein TNCV_2876421 [Trichonephila clavipes]
MKLTYRTLSSTNYDVETVYQLLFPISKSQPVQPKRNSLRQWKTFGIYPLTLMSQEGGYSIFSHPREVTRFENVEDMSFLVEQDNPIQFPSTSHQGEIHWGKLSSEHRCRPLRHR